MQFVSHFLTHWLITAFVKASEFAAALWRRMSRGPQPKSPARAMRVQLHWANNQLLAFPHMIRVVNGHGNEIFIPPGASEIRHCPSAWVVDGAVLYVSVRIEAADGSFTEIHLAEIEVQLNRAGEVLPLTLPYTREQALRLLPPATKS